MFLKYIVLKTITKFVKKPSWPTIFLAKITFYSKSFTFTYFVKAKNLFYTIYISFTFAQIMFLLWHYLCITLPETLSFFLLVCSPMTIFGVQNALTEKIRCSVFFLTRRTDLLEHKRSIFTYFFIYKVWSTSPHLSFYGLPTCVKNFRILIKTIMVD